MFACVCRGITESEVRRAGAGGVTAPGDLIAVFSLNDQTCCGRCADCIDEFVDLACQGALEAPEPSRVIAQLRPQPTAPIRA